MDWVVTMTLRDLAELTHTCQGNPDTGLERAVLAICLAKGEELAGAGYSSSLGCAHVQFLADYGYEVGDGDPVEAAEGESDSDGLGRDHDAA